MSRKLINNLVINLYMGMIKPQDLLYIIDYDKTVLKEIIYELLCLDCDDIIEQLLVEQGRNMLEFCYTMDVD